MTFEETIYYFIKNLDREYEAVEYWFKDGITW